MHPNERVLREIDEAMIREDMDAFWACYTDDCIAHVPGRNSLAGVYKGKDQFGELFGKFMERAGEYTFEPHAYLADDEHGVSMQTSKYRRGKDTLDAKETFACHFRDGKVSEMWFMTEDQAAFDAFIG